MNQPKAEGMSVLEILEAYRQNLNDLKQANDHIPLDQIFTEYIVPIDHNNMVLCTE